MKFLLKHLAHKPLEHLGADVGSRAKGTESHRDCDERASLTVGLELLANVLEESFLNKKIINEKLRLCLN